ncbi:MAG: ribbon-helix-helix protein, CopG family, partial [Thermomicrobiales bacterium]
MKTTLDVPEKTYQAFRELAQQMGRSEAEIMREA